MVKNPSADGKKYLCDFSHALNFRGNLGACNVRLENPAHPVRYRGVVCSMKENFGFIERADVVKEIFFHFSEAKSMKEELRLGDDVEFIIQTRNVSEEPVRVFFFLRAFFFLSVF